MFNIDPEYLRFRLKEGKELSYFMAQKNKESYIYNIVNLEGNPMTFPEVKTLLDGITVGGYKIEDEEQVLNQKKSFEVLLSLVKERKFNLNKEIFSQLNGIVAKGEALTPGQFRTGTVTIGGTNFIPPEPDKLDAIFEKGLEDISKIENDKSPLLYRCSYLS